MFRSLDANRLRSQINRFDVPMFVAEMLPDAVSFRFLAINEAHERESGLRMPEVAGKPMTSVLSPRDAGRVQAHFSRCIKEAPQMRYRELLALPRGPMIWETTLHHILPRDSGGADRIVGNSVAIERLERDPYDTLAFEDIRYFAATSSYKLGQIANVLDAVEQGRIAPERIADSVALIAGLCRTIDVTMQELRIKAQDRLSVQATPTLHLADQTLPELEGIQQAIAALIHTHGEEMAAL